MRGCAFFFLYPRRRSGERPRRGAASTQREKLLLSPSLSSNRMEEREWLRLIRVLQITSQVAPQPRGADGAARRPCNLMERVGILPDRNRVRRTSRRAG